jgi:hypothetical protein
MLSFPTIEEFKIALLTRPLNGIIKEFIFEGDPYVFRNAPTAMQALRDHLSKALSIQPENIIIIGSAKLGFSLGPDTMFRQFSEESDIDVLIVNEKIFDQIWQTILEWHYPRRLAGLDGRDSSWDRDRRRNLYWGWFVPDRIKYKGLSFPQVLKPLRDISTAWFNAFKSLSQVPELSRREVNGRLYRSWSHASLYHLDGLRQIKEIIKTEGEKPKS